MSSLKPLSWKEFVRKMKKLGFNGPFSGGKHPFMVRDDFVCTIPNPHKKDIGISLLKRILKQADIKTEEWLKE